MINYDSHFNLHNTLRNYYKKKKEFLYTYKAYELYYNCQKVESHRTYCYYFHIPTVTCLLFLCTTLGLIKTIKF
jgi:hypothetical protein